MSKRTEVSAKTVRAFFAEHPDMVTEDFAVSVKPGARGKLHPKAVEAFKQANPRLTYVQAGQAQNRHVTLTVVKVNAKGAKRKTQVSVPIAQVRALTGTEGKRGRISAEHLAEAASKLANA